MSFITEEYKGIPTGFRKILYFHWPLALLLIAVSCIGFLMLFSVLEETLASGLNLKLSGFA